MCSTGVDWFVFVISPLPVKSHSQFTANLSAIAANTSNLGCVPAI
nr:MAG TPA: hypothetical protein [Caudoviricetes sp.]